MSRYRKIDPRFWKDEKVRELGLSEKIIALYSFTGQSNRIGLFNFSPGAAAEDLGIPLETFREGFGKVCNSLNFGWDERARVIYLPTWWKYNCPENPNVLKACLQDLHEIPQTPLIAEFSENLRYLPETFHQTFREGLPKPSPQRMADQEQEQEQDKEKSGAEAPGSFFDKGEAEPERESDKQIPKKSAPKKRSLKPTRRAKGIPPDLQPAVSKIVGRINELAGTHYRDDKPDALKCLLARLHDGATEADCLAVVEGRHAAWAGNVKMLEYFRPSTLFAGTHFDDYLQDAQRQGNGTGAMSEAERERFRKETFING